MCCLKERVGAGILQPAQGHNINKEGQTETSVGGGGTEGGGGGGGGEGGWGETGWAGIYMYTCELIQLDYKCEVGSADNSLAADFQSLRTLCMWALLMSSLTARWQAGRHNSCPN